MASDPPASPRAVAGLDPYVSIRMGLHCRHHVQTRPVYQTDDNDQGHNVKWTSAPARTYACAGQGLHRLPEHRADVHG